MVWLYVRENANRFKNVVSIDHHSIRRGISAVLNRRVAYALYSKLLPLPHL